MQTSLVLFTFLTNLLLDDNRIPTLLVLRLNLILLLLLRDVVKILNAATQFMKAVLCLAITSLIKFVTIYIDLARDALQRLRNDWFYHKQYFAEADRILQDLDQIFVLFSHVFNFAPKLFFDAYKITQLSLQSTHLLILQVFVLSFEAPLHFIDLLLTILVSFNR